MSSVKVSILDDVSITHLTFGREFAKAIENKQVAQQDAERQQFIVTKADQERKAAIIRAEGEAEAASLISRAMQAAGNGLIEVRRIDAGMCLKFHKCFYYDIQPTLHLSL